MSTELRAETGIGRDTTNPHDGQSEDASPEEARSGEMQATRLDTAPEQQTAGDTFVPTPLREDEARDDSALLAPVERLLLVLRTEDNAYLLARRRTSDGEPAAHPVLLSTDWPHPDEGLTAGIAAVVHAHLGVRVEGEPRLSEARHPARMGHPHTGGPTMGLLRAVALDVSGEPEAGALYERCEALPANDAEAALSTDLERALFRDGVALFGLPSS